jgi:hypothetical protein
MVNDVLERRISVYSKKHALDFLDEAEKSWPISDPTRNAGEIPASSAAGQRRSLASCRRRHDVANPLCKLNGWVVHMDVDTFHLVS